MSNQTSNTLPNLFRSSASAGGSMSSSNIAVVVTPPLPPGTYTIKQLLSQISSPVSRNSARNLALRAGTQKHDFILASRLRLVPNLSINEFLAIIDSMNPMTIPKPIQWIRGNSHMLSESPLATFLDGQILGVAWQAVLEMLPENRNYDLQLVKQIREVEGTADRTFTILRAGIIEPLVIVEFIPAGVMKDLLSVLDSAARGITMDPTQTWKSVTSQLRMYAVENKVRHALVMDESIAIYFCFPPEPSLANEPHDYFYASNEPGSDFGVNPPLSVRELVVFAIVAALEKKNIELSVDSESDTDDQTHRPYQPLLHTPVPPSNSEQHREPTASEQCHEVFFERMDQFPNAALIFEMLPEKLPPRTHSARPGYRDSDINYRSSINPPGSIAAQPASPMTSVTILRILTRRVAVVSDGRTNYVAKLFPHPPGGTANQLGEQELAVYAACATLQGTHIPYLYAVGRVASSDTFVLLTEFIGSGITIEDYIDNIAEDDELAEAELADLRPGATAALQALHERGVVHCNLKGSNMVLDDDERIVIIDFECARVLKRDSARFRIAKEKDEGAFKAVFDGAGKGAY